jgi:protein-tyrosine phosphatase
MHRILFLCTGNYYRSRYAELLFNHLAPSAGLRWRADSRGLDVGRASAVNVGPLAAAVVERLTHLGIGMPAGARFPMQVAEADLVGAHRVIALKEAEHHALLLTRFPQWATRVEYWHIHDVDIAPPVEALAQIDANVSRLLAALQEGSNVPSAA